MWTSISDLIIIICDDDDDDDDDVCQELWRIVVHTLEKSVVLPPLADPRAVSQTNVTFCEMYSVINAHPVQVAVL